MTLYELIVESSRNGVALQDRSSGSMPAGHNGPYHDPETPVRNTGHWLILFLKAHEISGEQDFADAAEKALGYLMSLAARPYGAAFYHRNSSEKDQCNGLIGQAWTVEALAEAGRQLQSDKPLDLAREVFLQHNFDEEKGIWHRLAVEGNDLPYDMTFNHQLWFAAAGAMIDNRRSRLSTQPKSKTDSSGPISEVARRVERFLELLPDHFRIYSSGLIYHPLLIKFTFKEKIRDIRRMLLSRPSNRRAWRYKAIGYQLFNLYGFGLIHEQYPEHSFWEDRKFKKALKFIRSPGFLRSIDENAYGYPYNPPGFEMAYTIEQFDLGRDPDSGSSFELGSEEERRRWVSRQVGRCYNPESGLMDLESEDPATQAARLYEAARLKDLELEELSGEELRPSEKEKRWYFQ